MADTLLLLAQVCSSRDLGYLTLSSREAEVVSPRSVASSSMVSSPRQHRGEVTTVALLAVAVEVAAVDRLGVEKVRDEGDMICRHTEGYGL